MEFSPLDESKTSSDETDRSDDMGTVAVRSYGCVFCKRGFTTAQALGGHMNIHRKDRAKTRPSSVPPPMFDESYGSLRLSYPYNYNYTYPSSGLEPHHQVRYPVFLPAWDIARLSYNSHELPSSVQSDPLNRDFFAEEYWRQTQNLQAGPSNVIIGGPKMRVAEEDIDLELRLGYM